MKQGERQMATSLGKVDTSHRARYSLASKYIKAEDVILDFGCGTGYGSYFMASQRPDITVVAVDCDPEAVKFAINYFNHRRVTYELVRKELDQAASYDIITMFEVIEHVKNPLTILKNLYECLREGGALFLSTPDQRVMPYDPKRFPFHVRHFKQKEFEDLIKQAGFILERKFTQLSKRSPKITGGWGGAFNIALCRKLQKS